MDDPANQFVVVGKISSAYGIKGWVKIYSYTDPVTNILSYQPWYLSSPAKHQAQQKINIVTGRAHGKQVVAQIEGCTDRNQAELFRGLDISVPRNQLPEPEESEHYWVDLEGLQVINVEGQTLGVVDSMMETGANDVLVVKDKGGKEHLIPFVKDEFIRDIDMDKRIISVDWDPEF